MTATRRINPWWWLGLGFALTATKLWLSRGQGIYALGSAGHDDQLFIQLAEYLVHGDWLGPYNQLTLAKGPAYPLFIAASFALGLPLFLSQQLFYAGACAVFVRALRPAITSAGWRFAIYALLLCNPMTVDAPSMGRVLRQHIYGPLALLIIAGLVALYLRRQESVRRSLPWVLLLGFSAGMFYLTREEVLWLVPSGLLLAGGYLYGAWQISYAAVRRAGVMLLVAFTVATMPVMIVSAQNYRHYGWFGTCEFRASEFKEAYGTMLSVAVGPELPFVPVTQAARRAMASVSPTFAEVQHQLDAGIGRGWAEASEFFTHLPPERQEIGGGWMMWALRDAVWEAGPNRNAAQTLAFYQQIADEVNTAIDTGRLPGGARRHGFMPRWPAAQSGPFWSTALEFSDFVFSFRHFSARPPPTSGSPESLEQFRDLTRERLSPPEGELDVVGAVRYLLNLDKVNWLHATGRAMRPVLLVLFIVAQTLAIMRLLHAALRQEWSYPLTLAAAAWGACAASVLMHAMIQVSSFPVRTISSFAPIYPLLLVFIAAMFWDSALVLKSLFARKRVPTTAPEPSVAVALTRFDHLLPWIAGVAALSPFLVWHHWFAELFWFGDDLFLIDQMAAMGLRDWTTRVFSENFVPLFKLLWGGAVLVFNGSYSAMLWLMWLTHAFNTAILGMLLTRAGFSRLAMLVTLVLFALPPANLETLGWSVQWSAVLATTFLLLGLLVWQRSIATGTSPTWRTSLLLAFFAAASACSFSRGVLTGPVLALALLLSAMGSARWKIGFAYLPGSLLCLLPAVAVALVIGQSSAGNHQQMTGHWATALEFGLGYFLFNPGALLLGEASLHPVALVALAFTKIVVIFAGLWFGRGSVRLLLIVLLSYDLGNAVLLGIGRHHTGFMASLSSRYQYSSLLATLPFLVTWLHALAARLPARRLPAWGLAVVIVLLAGTCLRGWPVALAEFTGWRGTSLRQLMAAPPTNDPDVMVPALDFMHIERAKALQRAYNLH